MHTNGSSRVAKFGTLYLLNQTLDFDDLKAKISQIYSRFEIRNKNPIKVFTEKSYKQKTVSTEQK